MTSIKSVRKERLSEKMGRREFGFTEADVRAVSASHDEPKWLLKQRLAAWELWVSTPMPTVKDEPWRRTNLRDMPAGDFVVGAASDDPAPEEVTASVEGEVVAVLRPGHDPGKLYGEDALAPGVIYADWGTAVRDHAELVKEHLSATVKPEEGKFAAAAAALAGEGVFVYVPEGVQQEVPLHSVLWAPGENLAAFSRVLVVVEEGASATVIHESASGGDPAFHAGIVEVVVGDNAHLTFIEIQNWGEAVWNFTHERVRQGQAARLDWVFGSVGSHLTKNFSELSLEGQGAEGRWSGFYFADNDQHLDHDTQQNHMAPNTTSDLLFKGALIDKSRSVWQGMIYVAPGAQRTDGYQANRNLILSKEARADSIPGLEILADDVRCTHGATVSQLEEEPIFYLMSRGIPRAEAERLVVEGFYGSVLTRIPLEGIRSRFERMVDSKLRSSV